jgi:hypothetical protein
MDENLMSLSANLDERITALEEIAVGSYLLTVARIREGLVLQALLSNERLGNALESLADHFILKALISDLGEYSSVGDIWRYNALVVNPRVEIKKVYSLHEGTICLGANGFLANSEGVMTELSDTGLQNYLLEGIKNLMPLYRDLFIQAKYEHLVYD